MAVVMQMRWAGVTPEQYDQLREVTGMDDDPPAGGLFHVAWFEGDGIRVTDAWESAEQFQAFADSQLMPAVMKVGVEGQPEISILPAHAVLNAAAKRGTAVKNAAPAAVMVMRWDGVTPEQYDQVRDAVGWETDLADGGIHHIAWFDGGALNVVDVWESPEKFQAFGESRLMPGVASVGVEGEPETTFQPAHATYDPRAV